MTPPGTFDRVYAAIKERLMSGAMRPGDRLEPATLSDELNASVTPVRDALHRLTGERLVEAPRHEGFRVPLVTESMLRQLYSWHLDILLVALARARAEAADLGALDTTAPPDRLNAAFAEIATASGNPELAATLKNLSERLEPFERFEREFFGRLDEEIEVILQALRRGDRKALRRSLVDYHRRRQRTVPEILAKLHSS
jgi:DNA-binding GntR family transcriptional regulator